MFGNLSLTADITPAIDVKPESVIEHSNTPLSAPVLIADAFIISFLYILIIFHFIIYKLIYIVSYSF